MDSERIDAAARWLVGAHRRRAVFAPLPDALAPADLEAAYAVQSAFAAAKSLVCGRPIGRKIALTTRQMRAFAGLDTPIAGILHERQVVRGPGRVRAAEYGRLLVEFEIAIELEAPPQPPFDRAAVAAVVHCVMPAFEIADDRQADYTKMGERGLSLIADNAWNEGAVLGERFFGWRAVDLGEVRGVVRIDGRVAGEGRGADAMGHPFEVVAWIARELAGRGERLRAGDLIITGSLIASRFPRRGERLDFDCGPLGGVRLSVD